MSTSTPNRVPTDPLTPPRRGPLEHIHVAMTKAAATLANFWSARSY